MGSSIAIIKQKESFRPVLMKVSKDPVGNSGSVGVPVYHRKETEIANDNDYRNGTGSWVLFGERSVIIEATPAT